MKVRVQIIVEADDDSPPSVHEVAQVERTDLHVDTLGLHLTEAKDLRQNVQEVVVAEQVHRCLDEQAACLACGRPRRHKDATTIVLRTLFGTVHLRSPWWWHCVCRPQPTRTFSPLAAALPERTTPELLYLETKFSGLISYGQSASLLAETLPLGRELHATTVRRHAQASAERLEDELGPEQPMFIEGCQAEWDALPRPDLPLTVGLDGGYVHSSQQRSRRDGWFEVVARKSMPSDGASKCFGFVQTFDRKPKRRLFEVLKAQGMQTNQQVTFLTDGGDDVRELPLHLNPQAEHLLDWFHITMRLTVLNQMAKSVRSRDNPNLTTELGQELERLKWYLWHGNVFLALQTITYLQLDADCGDDSSEQRKLSKAVAEFGGTFAPTQRRYQAMASGFGPARPFPARLSSQPSIRWSASAWSRSNRCAGHRVGPICSSRSAPAS